MKDHGRQESWDEINVRHLNANRCWSYIAYHEEQRLEASRGDSNSEDEYDDLSTDDGYNDTGIGQGVLSYSKD